MQDRRPTCRSCGQRIRYFRTVKGKSMPCNPDPSDEKGNVLVLRGVAHVVSGDELERLRREGYDLFVHHRATCPKPEEAVERPRDDLAAKRAAKRQNARRGRDQALASVAGDAVWQKQALDAIRKTCEARPDFISDDVWEVGDLDSTVEDRALGPVMRRAARNGWCERTDRTRPSVRSHLSGKPVWKSLIHVADGRRQETLTV